MFTNRTHLLIREHLGLQQAKLNILFDRKPRVHAMLLKDVRTVEPGSTQLDTIQQNIAGVVPVRADDRSQHCRFAATGELSVAWRTVAHPREMRGREETAFRRAAAIKQHIAALSSIKIALRLASLPGPPMPSAFSLACAYCPSIS